MAGESWRGRMDRFRASFMELMTKAIEDGVPMGIMASGLLGCVVALCEEADIPKGEIVAMVSRAMD